MDNSQSKDTPAQQTDQLPQPRAEPVLYSAALAEEICRRLADGESLRAVCRDDHMPHERTARRWALDDKEGFAEEYANARMVGWLSKADEVVELLDEPYTKLDDGRIDMALVQDRKLRIDTMKWFLCKCVPRIYGDRLGLDHQGEGLTIHLTTGVPRLEGPRGGVGQIEDQEPAQRLAVSDEPPQTNGAAPTDPLVPAGWVSDAQARWDADHQPEGSPLNAVVMMKATSGQLIVVRRYGSWFARPTILTQSVKGIQSVIGTTGHVVLDSSRGGQTLAATMQKTHSGAVETVDAQAERGSLEQTLRRNLAPDGNARLALPPNLSDEALLAIGLTLQSTASGPSPYVESNGDTQPPTIPRRNGRAQRWWEQQ